MSSSKTDKPTRSKKPSRSSNQLETTSLQSRTPSSSTSSEYYSVQSSANGSDSRVTNRTPRESALARDYHFEEIETRQVIGRSANVDQQRLHYRRSRSLPRQFVLRERESNQFAEFSTGYLTTSVTRDQVIHVGEKRITTITPSYTTVVSSGQVIMNHHNHYGAQPTYGQSQGQGYDTVNGYPPAAGGASGYPGGGMAMTNAAGHSGIHISQSGSNFNFYFSGGGSYDLNFRGAAFSGTPQDWLASSGQTPASYPQLPAQAIQHNGGGSQQAYTSNAATMTSGFPGQGQYIPSNAQRPVFSQPEPNAQRHAFSQPDPNAQRHAFSQPNPNAQRNAFSQPEPPGHFANSLGAQVRRHQSMYSLNSGTSGYADSLYGEGEEDNQENPRSSAPFYKERQLSYRDFDGYF